ncbi:hypothetical protein [Photobacterium kishitanii]|uniref:Uncharacterized protein n=1 Tax=Photobacterium kishitanii TaxID=318456 RepID=A0A2T3KMH8_9GAMM|nr:hypothetical protein [Photobacterium kishitanii]PSV00988.1 hypothetical protein C9J27_02890 [Photobacterium kishitanii]
MNEKELEQKIGFTLPEPVLALSSIVAVITFMLVVSSSSCALMLAAREPNLLLHATSSWIKDFYELFKVVLSILGMVLGLSVLLLWRI